MSEVKPVRVLIADDYPPMVSALERLISLSCEVIGTVSNYPSLLDVARRLEPDVVVVDLNLPGGNSLVACQEIPRMRPSTRGIVVTAGLDPSLRTYVLGAGASAFIDKTAGADELLAAIIQRRASSDPFAP
jgi:DNA-binding NarL/FixJ family response regulator